MLITETDLLACHLSTKEVNFWLKLIANTLTLPDPSQRWQQLQTALLCQSYPFTLHALLFNAAYHDRPSHEYGRPAWFPNNDIIQTSNLQALIKKTNHHHFEDFFLWTRRERTAYWELMIKQLNIVWHEPYSAIATHNDAEHVTWFPQATLNIIESCFQAPITATAIRYGKESGNIETISYGKLKELTQRIAYSLHEQGFKPGDGLAIVMPMHALSVALYLGIIYAGCYVVSIADSFSPEEIATRLRLGKAVGVFTQELILRNKKTLPLYEKIVAAGAPRTIVLPLQEQISLPLQAGDLSWQHFLSDQKLDTPIYVTPDTVSNVLFSSGTTGDPKTIPWDHTTPLKAAIDAYVHQDMHAEDIICWPTNVGWMMGPWLIYATLINQASMALYEGAPVGQDFGRFVQNSQTTVLGVVPSLVNTWRSTACMETLDWSHIRLFSSTGECSNELDMLYLMYLAKYKPIIEYCGGTEIGGAYITSTIVLANAPAAFTGPALGCDFLLINEQGLPTDNGELALIPPSLGWSQTLWHRDHHAVYFAEMPTDQATILRRHGDHLLRLKNGFYRALGRIDDTMNLGGIKVSAAEIERVLNECPEVKETAAIATAPTGGGPSQLVIFAVLKTEASQHDIVALLQKRLREHLNPLFKIHDLHIVPSLPRTASNKIIRRALRQEH